MTDSAAPTGAAGSANESTCPRPEYPRPQFVRADWLNLNGEWQFESDRSDSGLERGLRDRELSRRITVPFCPESELSGIEDVDFHHAVWYRRTVRIPESWSDRRVLLHFQAVDYDTTVWVDGVEVGRHRGGFTPFTCDLGSRSGTVTIVLRARDPRSAPQARGKQSRRYANYACVYTRTTGIWQTVWLEPVPDVSLRRTRITPDLAGSTFHLQQPITANRPGWTVRATLADADGRKVATASVKADLDLAPRLGLPVPAESARVWGPGDPHLYGITVELVDETGAVRDGARTYGGLRSVTVDGQAIRINGEPVFQRLVLDQGYYPDGVMTAPSDDALVEDIELSIAAGFNGARLHQKVFEERFLYHADRLGYLVWGEFADWGSDLAEIPGTGLYDDNQRPDPSYVQQWLEALERDYSHPSIIGWCPLNETRQEIGDHITTLDDVTRAMFLATKAMDTTRPVLDASGYSHRVPETDVYDSHNYEQDPQRFAEAMSGLANGTPYTNATEGEHPHSWSLPYSGQPYFCSEFGGIWWSPGVKDDEDSWGYGVRPGSADAFYERFEGLVSVLLGDPRMFGYCYTQLTDVHQEQNGVYRFDRSSKLDVKRLNAAQTRPAAFEKA
ncbi:MAG: glycoside hydrolase family 2 protein [Mycobacteriales bacterium]